MFDTLQFSMNNGSTADILTLICNMNTTVSAGCPTNVTITPSTGTFEAGDVLTCSADGYDPTYTWIGISGVNGATISESGVNYTLPEGPFYAICTATVSQLSCCDSATVADTAYSKYQKQHNTQAIILHSVRKKRSHVFSA